MLDQVLKKLSDSLGKQSHIIGKESRYSNASVLVPLIEVNGEAHILYQVRSAHIRQGGEVSFPGGMREVEDYFDYKKTAIRETVEELGISESHIDVIGHLGTLISSANVTLDVYVGLIKEMMIDDMPLSDEVASVFTVPLQMLLDMEPEIHHVHMEIKPTYMDDAGNEVVLLDAESLGLPDRYKKPWGTRKKEVYFYRYGEQLIWGMTGEITYAFLECL